MNFQIFKLNLVKAEESEIKLPTSVESSKKQEISRKTYICALLIMPKALTVCTTTNCRKLLKRWEYQITLLAFREICLRVRKQQFRTGHRTKDWFQIGKGVCQGYVLSPCIFNLYAEYIMETLGWRKHQLESRLPEEISVTSVMQMTPSLWQKVKKN